MEREKRKMDKKIDLTEFNALMKEISLVTTKLSVQQLDDVKRVTKDLSKQIVDLCKDEFSEANYAYYNISDPKRCFEVFNYMGTSLAYVWFDTNGVIKISPNELMVEQRMN
jgi:hypothetical protein